MEKTADELVDAVHKIGPRLRELGEVADRDRRLPHETIDLLREQGFLRLWAPRSLGGLEIDPVTHARIQEEVSRYDSAAGWALMVMSATAWWCSRLPDEGCAEIYADGPDVLGTAAFSPPIEAVAVEGGYRITGRRPFASNCNACSWLWMTATVMDRGEPRTVDGNPVVIIPFFRAEEAEIGDTWHTLGMRGTDSNDIAVNDLFVPESRTLVIDPAAPRGSHHRGPLYRYPAMGLLGAFLSPVALGVGREAITEVIDIATGKTPFNSTTTLRERAAAQARIGRAEAILRSSRSMLYELLDEQWKRSLAGVDATIEQRAELLMAAVHAMQSATQAVEFAFSTAGTTGIYQRSRLERLFRDAEVLKQHGFVNESRYETVGQVLFGLPPDMGFLYL